MQVSLSIHLFVFGSQSTASAAPAQLDCRSDEAETSGVEYAPWSLRPCHALHLFCAWREPTDTRRQSNKSTHPLNIVSARHANNSTKSNRSTSSSTNQQLIADQYYQELRNWNLTYAPEPDPASFFNQISTSSPPWTSGGASALSTWQAKLSPLSIILCNILLTRRKTCCIFH